MRPDPPHIPRVAVDSTPRWPSLIGSRGWILSLAALTAVVALSIDLSLPAQPTLARYFDVADEDAQLTLSLFMVGFAGCQIVIGYFADAWGRRRVLAGGLAVFVVAGIGCTISPSIEVLIACRVLQGAGAAAGPVVARAMVRDTQPAAQAAGILSTMLSVLAIAPMVAPMLGGGLLQILDWRAIFGTLAVAGLAMYTLARTTLTETLPAERRSPASLRGLIGNYRKVLSTPGTRLPMLVFCATFAGQFAYIADSPFVLLEGYRVSNTAYGFYFASTALSLMLGSMTGGRMLRAGRAPREMIVIGGVILAFGGATLAAGTYLELGIAGFMVPIGIYFFGAGIVAPSSTALAMEPVPEVAGTASAAIGCVVMVSGAVSGYLTTRIGGSDPEVFSRIIIAMSAIALSLALLAARRRA